MNSSAILAAMGAALMVAPFLGQGLRWRDSILARRKAEEERVCALPGLLRAAPVSRLLDPWPSRQTPTDLAEAYKDDPQGTPNYSGRHRLEDTLAIVRMAVAS